MSLNDFKGQYGQMFVLAETVVDMIRNEGIDYTRRTLHELLDEYIDGLNEHERQDI